jgi:hypothetical protein
MDGLTSAWVGVWVIRYQAWVHATHSNHSDERLGVLLIEHLGGV